MGLLKHLVLWPVTGPSALIRFSLRHVESLAHRELTDDSRVKSDLLELQMLLELDEIDEAEYARREAAVLDRLSDVRAWRQRLGLEEEWAPLSFPPPEDPGAPPGDASDQGPEPGQGADTGSSASPSRQPDAAPSTGPSRAADADEPGGPDDDEPGEPGPREA